MKKLIVIAVLCLTVSQSFAAIVRSAKLDKTLRNILIDIEYSGGCKEHKFKLVPGPCFETYPLQCNAKLVDETQDDFCEAFIFQTISIPLTQINIDLNDEYYSGAHLYITGDKDYKTKKDSEAFIILPK